MISRKPGYLKLAQTSQVEQDNGLIQGGYQVRRSPFVQRQMAKGKRLDSFRRQTLTKDKADSKGDNSRNISGKLDESEEIDKAEVSKS